MGDLNGATWFTVFAEIGMLEDDEEDICVGEFDEYMVRGT